MSLADLYIEHGAFLCAHLKRGGSVLPRVQYIRYQQREYRIYNEPSRRL